MTGFDRLRKHLDGPPAVHQHDLAAELGIAQSLISQLRNKARQPPLGALPALNRKFGTKLEDWLLPKRSGARKPRRKKAA